MPNYPQSTLIIVYSISCVCQINLVVNSITTLNLYIQSTSVTASFTQEPTHMLSGALLINFKNLERLLSGL